MIKISTKGKYGTKLMLDLVLNYGNGPILLKDIAKRQEISEGYLEQIIPNLKNAGLLNSSRGAHGGYALAGRVFQNIINRNSHCIRRINVSC